MSRRSKSRSTRVSNHNTTQRVRSPFSNRRNYSFSPLTSYEDFRRWMPSLLDDRYPSSFPRSHSRIRSSYLRQDYPRRSLAMPRLYAPVSTGMGFVSPNSVVLCMRRRIRKSVLFAFNKTGRGGQRAPRWTANSLIHC